MYRSNILRSVRTLEILLIYGYTFLYGAYLHATLPFQRKGRVRKIGFSDELPNKLFELEEIKSNVDSTYYDNKSFCDLNIRINDLSSHSLCSI